MKITEMAAAYKEFPAPIWMILDRWGEKDFEIKRYLVALDYAIQKDYDSKIVQELLKGLAEHIKAKYFPSRALGTKVVFFLANKSRV